ncbi:MAG: hypothetical protein U9P72_08990 [Campylobacterota bacterium]|nr:hypothetical protein [Campylobacterota bacterium]
MLGLIGKRQFISQDNVFLDIINKSIVGVFLYPGIYIYYALLYMIHKIHFSKFTPQWLNGFITNTLSDIFEKDDSFISYMIKIFKTSFGVVRNKEYDENFKKDIDEIFNHIKKKKTNIDNKTKVKLEVCKFEYDFLLSFKSSFTK